jgi:hypothetical protein
MIDFMETAFPLTIEDTDMLPENFQTINETVKFIEGKLGISTAAATNGTEQPSVAPAPSPQLIAV